VAQRQGARGGDADGFGSEREFARRGVGARCARQSEGWFKRKPVLHVFDITTGDELWKRELESEVEMMPARWSDDDAVPYTLDNYRAPVFLDNRLYVFYEGLTSLDAHTGKERQRDKFRVNEEGLALTEADPVAERAQRLHLGTRQSPGHLAGRRRRGLGSKRSGVGTRDDSYS